MSDHTPVASEFCVVYMTTSTRAEAIKISRILLEKRLVACTNLLDGMLSFYHWEGQIRESVETVLMAKTRTALVQEIIEEVKSEHTYKVPCVLAYELTEANPDYLEWLSEETMT